MALVRSLGQLRDIVDALIEEHGIGLPVAAAVDIGRMDPVPRAIDGIGLGDNSHLLGDVQYAFIVVARDPPTDWPDPRAARVPNPLWHVG